MRELIEFINYHATHKKKYSKTISKTSINIIIQLSNCYYMKDLLNVVGRG